MGAEEVEFKVEETFGEAAGAMWVAPVSGSTECGRPVASNAADSRSVCAATTLSSTMPCTSSSGRACAGSVTGSAASSTSEWCA